MAGDRDRHRIRGAGRGHRARGAGLSDAPRDLRVADRLAGRDRAQRLPHAELEGRAADVERQVEAERGLLDEADDRRHPALEAGVAARERGLREAILQRAHEAVGVVTECDRAHAHLGGRDEHRAQRALPHREADRRARAARTRRARPHPEPRRRAGVEAPARVEARAIHRRGHARARRQPVAHPPRALAVGVGLGRDAGQSLEDPVEVEAAQARGRGEAVEARQLVRALDEPAGARHGLALARGDVRRGAGAFSGRGHGGSIDTAAGRALRFLPRLTRRVAASAPAVAPVAVPAVPISPAEYLRLHNLAASPVTLDRRGWADALGLLAVSGDGYTLERLRGLDRASLTANQATTL